MTRPGASEAPFIGGLLIAKVALVITLGSSRVPQRCPPGDRAALGAELRRLRAGLGAAELGPPVREGAAPLRQRLCHRGRAAMLGTSLALPPRACADPGP